MVTVVTKKRISVAADEYARLKQLDKRFGVFLDYVEYLKSIDEARKQKRGRKGVEQSKLFKQLAI